MACIILGSLKGAAQLDKPHFELMNKTYANIHLPTAYYLTVPLEDGIGVFLELENAVKNVELSFLLFGNCSV